MANNFKNALARNVGTTPVEVYEAPATKKAIVIELDVCNTTNGAVTTSVFITSGGLDFFIVKNAPVPVGGSLQVISGQKIVLTNLDTLNVVSSSAASLDVIGSILEDV
jgi:hypothetical protein